MNLYGEYRDGWTDPQNGRIFTENWVKTVKYPRLTWVSEKIGLGIIKGFYAFDILCDPTINKPPHHEPSPRVSRIIGAGSLSLVGVVVAINIGVEFGSFIANSPEQFSGVIDAISFDPSPSISAGKN